MTALNRFVCDNCGFWQESFAAPASCPVCTDFRHTPPARPFRFLTPEQAASEVASTWAEVVPGVWEIRAEPSFGIGTVAYFIEHEAGNILWDGAALYSESALAFIESRGGLRWLSASHPHAYGAAWQLQERFAPTVAIQVLDLPWTNTLRVSVPFDDRLELAPGLEIRRTGGHFDGHSVLFWREKKLLFAGDMVKFHFDQWPVGLSCHKAFNRQVPLSHGELWRYREAIRDIEFETILTSFDRGACTRDDALALFEARLAGAPSCGPIDLPSASGTCEEMI
jgi:glyoxylase-like metal-dependent hydrolase (beta-lactamase superfamily II)